jgi:hypothetical protein
LIFIIPNGRLVRPRWTSNDDTIMNEVSTFILTDAISTIHHALIKTTHLPTIRCLYLVVVVVVVIFGPLPSFSLLGYMGGDGQ